MTDVTGRQDPPAETGHFEAPVAAWTAGFPAELRRRLAVVPGLSDAERTLIVATARTAQLASLQRKLNRLLLLELRAQSLTGALPGADGRERWAAFQARARTPGFRERLERRYPGLGERVARATAPLADAAAELARRLAGDRDRLPALLGRPAGRLTALRLGAGDPHQGGRTVAHLTFEGGSVMYKPRPLDTDTALEHLLVRLWSHPGAPSGPRPRTPRALLRDGYGWTAHVPHRYCADEAELAQYYRTLGHWLALMRLTGGTDLHAENLIAHGPEPVVVDAECLFTQDVPPAEDSGRGAAVDAAAAVIRRTVLRTGILPTRMGGYAMGGTDLSAAGAIPGQQPLIPVPVIAGGGTDGARMDTELIAPPPSANLPAAEPALFRHWDQVLDGFRELTAHLHRMDSEGGGLPELLRPFTGCRVRNLRRGTQAYVDIGRMLWHPASLHRPQEARRRAREVLLGNARALPGAPDSPEIIESEIEDLLTGDIPVFTAVVDAETIRHAVADWRGADLRMEESVIQGALVGAYLNERTLPPRVRADLPAPRHDRLERRRRAMAAGLVRTLCEEAVTGEDSTVTWVSPVLTGVGWAIRPLSAELYTGQGGVAVALAGYLREARRGRADPVPGLEGVLEGALRVLAATEDTTATAFIGGYTGIASQVWTWTELYGLLGDEAHLARARLRAAALTPELLDEDTDLDVLGGAAGVIVPLLNLAHLTGEERWLATAARAARRLERTAVRDDRGARWSTALFAEGIGGFAHGATGMGWALHRLALGEAGADADRRRWRELAGAALSYEESLWDPAAGNWHDARIGSQQDHATAWCHGSTGIGLAAVDLYHRTGDRAHLVNAHRAAAAGLADGFGWSHTLCHGDLGLIELLTHLRALPAPAPAPDPGAAPVPPPVRVPDPRDLLARLLTDLEHRGPVGGLARESFSPGLMPGLSGVLHLLLRLTPDATGPGRPRTPLLLTAPEGLSPR